MNEIEYSILIETFTLQEGGASDRFFRTVAAGVALAQEDQRGEVLVIDVCGFPDLAAALQTRFPEVRVIDAVGLGYDAAKMKAARESRGAYVLFLDGDCLPQPGWKDAFLERLRAGAPALGGYTRYDGGFRAALESVMDFGFLYPCAPRDLQCYAFNNSAFSRRALMEIPAGSEHVRCACYRHAQEFLRRGTPVRMVPEARVLHEVQPLVRERTRQGFDRVAACWADPAVHETPWLRAKVLAAPLFYAVDVLLDWRRASVAQKALGLPFLQWLLLFPLFPLYRLLDFTGMLRALILGPVPGGWSGSLARQRTSL